MSLINPRRRTYSILERDIGSSKLNIAVNGLIVALIFISVLSEPD